MIRTFLIIAGAALVLSLVCLGGAMALGGSDLRHHDWTWTVDDDDGDGVHITRADRNGAPSPETTRTVAWTGGDSLVLELPADVTYVQGPAATVTVTGPKDAADRVRVEGSRIAMGDRDERVTVSLREGGLHAWSDSDRVKITVTAPSVSRFEIDGSSDVRIENYDQPTLTLTQTGSGDTTAIGRAPKLAVTNSGSGDIDLSDLTGEIAEVDLSGSGDATVAPTTLAALTLSGSGDVNLASRPQETRSNVSGSGTVNQD